MDSATSRLERPKEAGERMRFPSSGGVASLSRRSWQRRKVGVGCGVRSGKCPINSSPIRVFRVIRGENPALTDGRLMAGGQIPTILHAAGE